ncbi:hypothetical protein BKH29_10305 [Actinomyces oris]|uniref:Uncharacterized protein n=1 Tax=Actinomyces oris TaxID=544580 RepID=A0A1Q8V5Z8_9ACTO|nr:hypothetical protein [Actinomyces oris]OLO43483.1 hypothetical protein BKH29_10305 [Actinomyces oris]
MSKERRLEPQITVGLLTDEAGFPLRAGAFEGNKAEAATWMSALGCDVTMLVRGPRLLLAAESFASRLIESFTSEASYEGE